MENKKIYHAIKAFGISLDISFIEMQYLTILLNDGFTILEKQAIKYVLGVGDDCK